MVTSRISGLYLISDTSASRGRGHEDIVREALAGGAGVVQLREKRLTLRELYPVAVRLRELTRDAGAMFVVNDSVELAMAAGADGVHLGQDDMPISAARKAAGAGMLIGISTHSLEQAVSAEAEGADYIGFGPIFSTETKDAGAARGIGMLRSVRSAVGIPIVAIGGIDAVNAASVLEAGADALAVISAVTGADDIRRAALDISALFVRR